MNVGTQYPPPPHTHTHTHTGLSPDIEYTVFVTSETNITNQIPVEFILARGDAVVHTIVVQTTSGITPTTITGPANSELVVGVTVSVVAVVINAIAMISVFICIACVYHNKQVRETETELKEVQTVQPNPSCEQATQPNPSCGGAMHST